ncbi:MAG: hypothetical protein K2X57_03045 [Xanthobacteraceae bacterium]|nr:hypothetical protein [Xanthobacteraceae bacterium]
MAKTVAGISASRRAHVPTAKAARKGPPFLQLKQDDNNATSVCCAIAHAIDLKVTKFADRLPGIRFKKNPDHTSPSEQY